MKNYKIILDTDIGDDIDDAFALALLIKENVSLLGVTTVFKNSVQRAKIVKYELEQYGINNVEVYAGYDKPLVKDIIKWGYETINDDGRINIKHYNDELMRNCKINETGAVDFILNTIKENPNEVTLIAIGPLTNIAMAIKKDIETFKKVKCILMMGGEKNGTYPEWNIKIDPQAANIVFNSKVPIKSVGVDITSLCKFTNEDINKVHRINGPLKIVSNMMDIWIHDNPLKMPTMHDPLAVSELFNHFCKYEDVRFIVDENTGKFIIGDDKPYCIKMANSVKKEEFINYLLNKLKEK